MERQRQMQRGIPSRNRSSIFARVEKANSAVDGKQFWGVALAIGLILGLVHSLSYVAVEYGMFDGKSPDYNVYTPEQKCMSELANSGFDLLDTDKYHKWMDKESSLIIAETGEYKGPDEIKEYINFARSDFFDYLIQMDSIVPTPIRFTKDECSILFTMTHKTQVNAKYGDKKCYERVFGYKLHYSPKSFKINHINVYYPGDFLSELFGKALDSNGTGDYICDVMENNCRGMFDSNNLTSSSCRSMYDSLPSTNAEGYLDDKSKGCRILHSAFAAQNENHCPHLSFIPQEDYKGQIKCQKSEEVKPSDLFSAFELDTIKEQGREWGFDESLYHTCPYDPDYQVKDSNFGQEFSFANSVPTDDLNDKQFQVYVGFIMYVTMVMTGLGMEYFGLTMLLGGDWNQVKENQWRVAQFVFPILGATTVGLANTGNFLALPFLVVTMWKLGFPETILLLYSALYDKENSVAARFVEFTRGMGTIVHHSSSALYVAMVVTHVLPSTQDVVAITMPLLMQHWFVLLKYQHKLVYIILAILVEVWFEWTAFSVLPAIHELHWIGGVMLLSMLFAHWCLFGAGSIALVFSRDNCDAVPTDETNTRIVRRVCALKSFSAKNSAPSEMFKKINKDGSGYVERDELQEGMKTIDEVMPQSNLNDI